MKKLNYLFLIVPLFLSACFQPPTPNVAEAIQNADPNLIVPLSNDVTNAYFRTALPFVASPSRGLIYEHIRNRADIGQVEMSLMRIATDYFDPDTYYIREGQHLTRELVSDLLRHHSLEPEYGFESISGLNPPLGSTHTFGEATFESTADDRIRPLAYILEQNFVTLVDTDDFQLEGVAIAMALNPFYWEVDQSIGFEYDHQMEDEEILAIGKEMAANLLPHLRAQEPLSNVPILIGLYILRADRDVIPGRFASVTHIEPGRPFIEGWTTINERHFSLPDHSNAILTYDVNLNDEFIAFRDAVVNYFPHTHGIVSRAHLVDGNVYRLSITFNMNFLGATEKVSFFQLLEQNVINFSREYDVRIIVRNLETLLGAVNRPPGGEAFIHLLDW
ncbi:MAG: CamS family sex pheromone protein [Defluviitaleaceae bacterium]|nr:CamS family sex pheromone protein [Defluviitaleaceae bacterium]